VQRRELSRFSRGSISSSTTFIAYSRDGLDRRPFWVTGGIDGSEMDRPVFSPAQRGPLVKCTISGFFVALMLVPVPAVFSQTAVAIDCPALSPMPGKPVRACRDEKPVACATFDPARPLTLRSNRCVAEKSNADLLDPSGRVVDYSYFGATDCRAGAPRPLNAITHVVVHNGGSSGAANVATWQCRQAAAHYTIERDGRIVQHMGEELVGAHAIGMNARSIGVELNTGSFAGTSCNSLDHLQQPLAKLPTPERHAAIDATCAPTMAQYASLRLLLARIVIRTAVRLDEEHVVGHCEVDPPSNGHRDPRGFDWSQINLSNEKKRGRLRGTACDANHLTRDAREDSIKPSVPASGAGI
jgi:N-acetyl-anhydromuramyl-L-alanine amidase AmpD